MSVKEAAHPAIEALPDSASLQDAADRVALLAALEKGRQAVREGRWKSPEEVEKLLSSWLEKQSGRTRQ
jgi:predicted transcriptional regulator